MMATLDNSGPKIRSPKKQILLNAFDMSTVGHLSVGHWKVSKALFKIQTEMSVDVYRIRPIDRQQSAN